MKDRPWPMATAPVVPLPASPASKEVLHGLCGAVAPLALAGVPPDLPVVSLDRRNALLEYVQQGGLSAEGQVEGVAGLEHVLGEFERKFVVFRCRHDASCSHMPMRSRARW